MFRFVLFLLLVYLFYKFFKTIVEKKKSAVKGPARDQQPFQQKYKDLIEDADFEELDGDQKD